MDGERRNGGRRLRGAVAAGALAALALVAGPATAVAQDRSAEDTTFSVERIYGTADFHAESFSATWGGDGTWIRTARDEEGRPELVEVRARSGRDSVLVPAGELLPEDGEPLSIWDVDVSPDGRRLLLFTDAREVWRDRTRGTYYLFDLDARELRPLSREPGWQMFAKFSPDGDRVAFVRDHDVHVVDVATGREWAVTETGSETVINGTTDWVYEEELGLRDAFRWSPDGRRIAYWQLDQSPIPIFHLVDQSTLYPELTPLRYPKAGQENSLVRVGVVPADGGEARWMETGPRSGIYIPRMEWVDSSTLGIQRLNRAQDSLEVLLGDASTGRTRTAFTETDSAWVEVDDQYRWLEDGRLLWTSERSGYNHLYLFDRSGDLIRPLTRGSWDVTDVYGVDEERGVVYLQAARRSPGTRQVLAVELSGGEPRVLSGGAGWHEADFAPGFDLYVETRSAAATPPRVLLRSAGGDSLRTLVENAELAARVDSLGLRPPEFFQVEAADGTPLNAYLIRPADFDSTRTYPLLMYAYGGPGAQTVTDRWGGGRYLWHQLLADRHGILVASVDNRGTGARGRDFKKGTFLRLGHQESRDQLAAREQLAARPYVDGERTALWGWSYGGYLTLLTLMEGPGAFAAGVSVAPVTHWKLYDTIYTERYMRTPTENPEGYRESAPLNYADRLASSLLLVHGTGDDNVHFQHTLQMVGALEEANKQFRLRIYPGGQHGISGPTAQVNLFRMITDFLAHELDASG